MTMIKFQEEIQPLLQEEFSKRRDNKSNQMEGKTRISVGYPVYGVEEVMAALETLLDLRLSQGEKTEAFERQFAAYVGMPSSIAVNSGSSANLLALNALIDCGYLKRGDEVIVPAATFATVSSPIYQLGLVPVYLDVDESSWCLDPLEIEAALTKKTKLIMPVHNLGFPANMERIMKIANRHSLLVLEDCCESHGAEWQGKKVGSFGLVSTLSFFVAHNITTGEGGMIFTRDPQLEAALRSLREFGRLRGHPTRFYSDEILKDYDHRYVFTRLGFNVRMTEMVAALGLVQLNKLESLNKRRREIAGRLLREIEPFGESIRSLTPTPGTLAAYYGFPLIVKENSSFTRRELCEHLEAHGIETRAMMGGCLPDQPGFRNLSHRIVGKLERSRRLRDHAFFIGCHSGIQEEGVSHITKTLSQFLEKHSR
ncbi:MAG: aminotransferase class I/II-fold pyridoxal phosphate-dependent enzyme [Deltaproteobacteria bacterium]|nr:aminotransferase class I/II-fold pyridoxal phosphate-dependent enzyme [Deltaproteobacteria bacterium]